MVIMLFSSIMTPPMGIPPPPPGLVSEAIERPGKGGAVGGRPVGKGETPGDTGDGSLDAAGGNNCESGEDG